MDRISWELLDNEMDKVGDILGGFRCHICGKEVKLRRNITSVFENSQGIGFMRIAMGEHLKAHIRRNEAAKSK